MDEQSENVTETVVCDVITFVVLGAFNLFVAKFVKPSQRGFFCDDESIRYPARLSTVPSAVLNIVGISVPILLILLLEYLNKRRDPKELSSYRIGKFKIPTLYWGMYKMLAVFGSGALFSQTLTDIGKKVIGRLRPNFIDVCKPLLAELCSNPNNYNLISNFECFPKDGIDPNVSRVSFPSGHSSFAFYSAVFVVLYLQKRFKPKSTIAKPILQFAVISIAWFTALSRVMDNKHHWSDVLAGILLGSIVAIINTVFVHRIFEADEYHAAKSELPTNARNHPVNGTSTEAHAEL